MYQYRQIKGFTYEEFVFNSLLNDFDNVYYFKDTPEFIIAKTKLYLNQQIYHKYKNCDIGADLVAVKDDEVYFIQCKNFSQTISINDFCSFYFLILEFELNGLVYYNGVLSERLTDLAQGKIKYINLPFNNSIIDVNFIGLEKNNIVPRDYQIEIYNKFKNINRGIISLPCGMGKTLCSWLLGKDYDNIIIISPTRNLADTNLIQLYGYSDNKYNPILISMDGSRDEKEIINLLKDKNIISSTYDSVDILNKIITKIKNYIIFVDEFHNLSSNNLTNKNDQIYNMFSNKLNKILFLSATPLINDKYNKIFGNEIFKYDWNKAIENKYICDFKIIIPDDINNLKLFNELINNEIYNEENKEIIKKIYFLLKGVNYYGNKKIIIYCSNIDEGKEYFKHIEWIKNMLNMDIETNQIDYMTSKTNRINYIKQFKKNSKIQILINVQILNEGIDIPECDSIYITTRITNTINLIQRMCRCNRIIPNKNVGFIYIWNNSNKKTINEIFQNINFIVKSEIFNINNYTNTNSNYISTTNCNEQNLQNNINENFLNNDCKPVINLDKVSKLFDSRKETIKNTLINSYTNNIDFTIYKKDNILKKGRPGELILLTPKCFNKLCLNSKNKRAIEIKNLFLENKKEYLNIINNLISI